MNDEKIIMTEETEYSERTADTAAKSDKNTYTLKKPFDYEGKVHTEFKFDFEKLSGLDMISAEDQLRDRGKFIITPENDTEFIIAIAARAANVSDTVLSALPLNDFVAIKRMTQRFLNSRD